MKDRTMNEPVSFEPSREEIRDMVIAAVDVRETIGRLAMQGVLDTSDLWWLFDKHRMMASGNAWLMAMLWEDSLTAAEEDLLSNPSFWNWFDLGRR
jgi:hypothetical protein